MGHSPKASKKDLRQRVSELEYMVSAMYMLLKENKVITKEEMDQALTRQKLKVTKDKFGIKTVIEPIKKDYTFGPKPLKLTTIAKEMQ